MKKKLDFTNCLGRNAVISKISQIINDNFVDFYVVKVGGIIFSDGNDNYKYNTREEAELARKRIKKIIKEELAKL